MSRKQDVNGNDATLRKTQVAALSQHVTHQSRFLKELIALKNYQVKEPLLEASPV